jgi:hypothetical protein
MMTVELTVSKSELQRKATLAIAISVEAGSDPSPALGLTEGSNGIECGIRDFRKTKYQLLNTKY